MSSASGRAVRALEPLVHAREPDDLSSHGHRQLIGWLGLLLPVLLWGIAGARPTDGLAPRELLQVQYTTTDEAYEGMGIGQTSTPTPRRRSAFRFPALPANQVRARAVHGNPGMATGGMARVLQLAPPTAYGVTPSRPLLAAQPMGPDASSTQSCV